ncbi:MAG: metallophosphoesterase, partial [Deltaproteobacteria bacterium]|nr:metallophosphoesterase [Deltaproteobacteria bacterium]
MSLFLLSFLLIYGGFHLYFFLKVKAALSLPAWGYSITAVFLLLMIAAPILVRLAERSGFEQLAIFLAYFGFIWMGIVFVFSAAALAVDCYRILIWAGGLILQKKLALQADPKAAFYLPLAFSLFVSILGAFEAWDIRLEKVTLSHEKIPASLNGFRIVQISDVHLGLIVRHRRLQKILAVVKQAEPDILVSTGDLVDGQISRLEGLAEMLQEIRPQYGKYAVTGNHEFYAGLEEAITFTHKAGFVVLRNTGVSVTPNLNIAGVDDRALHYRGKPPDTSEASMLQSLDREKFTLLLKHRPDVDRASLGFFDLQLSGHTHKGQIFPFNI